MIIIGSSAEVWEVDSWELRVDRLIRWRHECLLTWVGKLSVSPTATAALDGCSTPRLDGLKPSSLKLGFVVGKTIRCFSVGTWDAASSATGFIPQNFPRR